MDYLVVVGNDEQSMVYHNGMFEYYNENNLPKNLDIFLVTCNNNISECNTIHSITQGDNTYKIVNGNKDFMDTFINDFNEYVHDNSFIPLKLYDYRILLEPS